jgi:peptidoglycan/xylan/chitin deacetylase (PgdA/CDA1 family)
MNNKKLIIIILVAATITAFIIFKAFTTDKNSNRIKVAILKFSDSSKSQYANARPILNGYGFKGSFFITCSLIASAHDSPSMTWENVATLQKEGHDIQSGSMTYAPLTNLSMSRLDYELQQSKQCLLNHGINAKAFGMPYGGSWNNSTIINTVAKYYDFSVNGFSNLMYLHCDGWKNVLASTGQQQQFDCKTYLQNGTLTFANRYSIREWNHNTFDVKYSHDNAKILNAFVNEVNRQTPYNYYGKINAIPIIAYHNIDDKKKPNSTGITLFADEMKYLHDNGFKVITIGDLDYDENNDFISVVGGIT